MVKEILKDVMFLSQKAEKATKILVEKEKAEEIQPHIIEESVIVTGEKEGIAQISKEITIGVQEVAGSGARINEFGEIIRENNNETIMPHIDFADEVIPQKTVKIVKSDRNFKKIKQKIYSKTGLRVGIVQ